MFCGKGRQSRRFCHVSNVVRALTQLSNQPRAVRQIYNVGSAEEIPILELAKRVKHFMESRPELQIVPYNQDVLRRKPSTSKIHQLCGWQPACSLKDITLSVVEYHRAAHR